MEVKNNKGVNKRTVRKTSPTSQLKVVTETICSTQVFQISSNVNTNQKQLGKRATQTNHLMVSRVSKRFIEELSGARVRGIR